MPWYTSASNMKIESKETLWGILVSGNDCQLLFHVPNFVGRKSVNKALRSLFSHRSNANP
jgi:hypothetical protein